MSDEQIRERLLALWTLMGTVSLAAHCGGRGLAVGCPVCRKRWAR